MFIMPFEEFKVRMHTIRSFIESSDDIFQDVDLSNQPILNKCREQMSYMSAIMIYNLATEMRDRDDIIMSFFMHNGQVQVMPHRWNKNVNYIAHVPKNINTLEDLYDALVEHFDSGSVFRDIHSEKEAYCGLYEGLKDFKGQTYIYNKTNAERRVIVDYDDTLFVNGSIDQELVNTLNNMKTTFGNEILVFTARGHLSANNRDHASHIHRKEIETNLKQAGLMYDGLSFIKPLGDLYIDDKAITPEQFKDDFKNFAKKNPQQTCG